MFLDRVNPRMQITVVLSVGIHLLLVKFFGTYQFTEAPRRIKLTEVEFQQEVVKPTEMEKLMTKLVAQPKPAPGREQEKIAAIEELEKTSFSKVVGVKHTPRLEDISELDLTNLAALPKFNLAQQPPAPVLSRQAPKRIALVRSRASGLKSLESKVVPLEGLPPSDFGPEISRRNFQQPELIIKKVKIERRRGRTARQPEKSLNLRRESFITGEVKNRAILHREFPQLPRWLEEKGIEAEVVIRFVVDPDGEVGDKIFVEKTSGYAELDRLAIAALKKFVFAPLPLTVRQVEQSGTIVIHFGFRK